MNLLWLLLLVTVTVYLYAMLWEKVDDLRQERDQQGIGASQLQDKATLIWLALIIAYLFKIFYAEIAP